MSNLIRIGLALYLLYAGLFGVFDYFLLRWLVFLGGLYLLYNLLKNELIDSGIKAFFFIVFIIMVILFNPLVPVFLYDRSLWVMIDIIMGILLLTKPMFIKTLTHQHYKTYNQQLHANMGGFYSYSNDDFKFYFDQQLGAKAKEPDYEQFIQDAKAIAGFPVSNEDHGDQENILQFEYVEKSNNEAEKYYKSNKKEDKEDIVCSIKYVEDNVLTDDDLPE